MSRELAHIINPFNLVVVKIIDIYFISWYYVRIEFMIWDLGFLSLAFGDPTLDTWKRLARYSGLEQIKNTVFRVLATHFVQQFFFR